jgi:hypothetical protein
MLTDTAENVKIKIEELDEKELLAITRKYPYYPVAQFQLLSKYKQSGNRDFEKQALITALFFNNVNWLNKQLHDLVEKQDVGNIEADVNQSESIGVKQFESVDVNQSESDDNANINETAVKVAEQISRENKDEALSVFEPLHTVDYFASQGIKVPDEPISNDRLSNQLKSFTEWLKSMKKIHNDQLPGGDEQTDRLIQNLAEGSNINTHVITEAMADVLVKQNKIEQAIEMYEKLSLNYPAKSGYFAAKIQSLKQA